MGGGGCQALGFKSERRAKLNMGAVHGSIARPLGLNVSRLKGPPTAVAGTKGVGIAQFRGHSIQKPWSMHLRCRLPCSVCREDASRDRRAASPRHAITP